MSALITCATEKVRKGRGLAIAGILLNVAVILVVIGFPTFCRILPKPKFDPCKVRLRSLSYALICYSQDYDGYLPPARDWNKAIETYLKNRHGDLRCPKSHNGQPTFAVIIALTGIDLDRVSNPESVVMAFECVPGRNRVGGEEMMSFPHDGLGSIAFADGHIKKLNRAQALEALSSSPKIGKSPFL